MICGRCGSECPYRAEGHCLHCLVGLECGLVDKETNLPVKGVGEGFPDWLKPTRKSIRQQEQVNRGQQMMGLTSDG